ncbi:MAG: hypothetical protein BGWL_c2890 [Candidatus Phytoplasma cynodontis]|uniref:hypothetical protein n=1 Tax='Cynodon dactylon' phytoplasma TaxID=295320 RepID=UPI001265C44F|nr:hypothetical protein ['Cynodon dactylon' phytoplasma]KAB8121898.1 hypothetical protein F1741_01445 ['Cynodon dactylon' phytoplasma]WIA07774.1 MAG: hypothetical protein BGWL_c2890 [Candidatus Phytoplasma cynodontis]
MIQQKKIFSDLFKIIFSFLFAISCFFYDKLTFEFSFGKIKICDIFLGILIFIINYYFIIPKINGNRKEKMVKFLFFFESLILILISLGFLFNPFIERFFLKNFFQINNMILCIIIIHSIVLLYTEYLKKNKPIFPINFFSYLSLFGFSCYLYGKKINLTFFILKFLGLFFLILTLFFIFIFWKRNIFDNKKQKEDNLTE